MLARDSDRRPRARPSRPDRRASGVFALTGPFSRHPLDTESTAVVWLLSQSDPDGAGRSRAEYDPALPWGTDANGVRLTLGADPAGY